MARALTERIRLCHNRDANLEIILALVAAAHAPTTATVLRGVVEMIPSNGPLAGQGKK